MEIILIAIGVFGLIGSSVFLILAPQTGVQGQIIQRRLESIGAKKEEETTERVRLFKVEKETFLERVSKFFLGENDLPARYTSVRRILHQAGYPGERRVRVFWGLRFFLAGLFAVGAFSFAIISAFPIPHILLLMAAGGCLGSLLPLFYVRRKAISRRQEIKESLPDTLDLLVVCVEAGLGVDSALVRVAEEQESQGLAIGQEFHLMTQEILAGITRRRAMSRLADRLDLDEMRGLVTFLTQTEEMGGSIARSLRVFAGTMRQKRSQSAEESARKAVIKLIFPVVLFIMPAVFLVSLAPATVNMITILGGSDMLR